MDLLAKLSPLTAADVGLLLLATVVVYVIYSTRHFGCFKDQGIPGPQPWPVIGNIHTSARMGHIEAQKYWIEKYGKRVGMFVGSTPMLMTTDPDMVRSIMVKDFAHFHNRPDLVSDSETFSQTLIALRDGQWKHVRVQLSPAFSSAKLKQMTSDMNACAALLIKNLLGEVDNKAGISIVTFMGAFAMDVIARTVFGLQVNSQLEPESPFVLHAKQAFGSLKRFNPSFFLGIVFPFLRPAFHWLNLSTVDRSSEEFFTKVIEQAMQTRKEGNNDRVDFLQQMLKCNKEAEAAEAAAQVDKKRLEASSVEDVPKKEHKKGLTHTQILANSMLFFIAAYDTTSTTLMYLLYNLALNPDCQQRVADEVNEVMGDEDEVRYEMMREMTYLDKCLQETLRMYPPAISVSREAYIDVVVNGVVIRKDTMVHIPVYVLHHDPQVYPQPDKFDPERFSPEAKAARNPFCYLPFGVGPHSCIGMHLAQQEIKIVMAAVLQRFRFVPCPQTQFLPTFKSSMILTPEKDIMLAVEKR
ncbi:Cytochrome P450 3A24 [Lamellibrachia satsuma]|nr:Cytochrome P450 3A24 [Lamellibrachia satsuma]